MDELADSIEIEVEKYVRLAGLPFADMPQSERTSRFIEHITRTLNGYWTAYNEKTLSFTPRPQPQFQYALKTDVLTITGLATTPLMAESLRSALSWTSERRDDLRCTGIICFWRNDGDAGLAYQFQNDSFDTESLFALIGQYIEQFPWQDNPRAVEIVLQQMEAMVAQQSDTLDTEHVAYRQQLALLNTAYLEHVGAIVNDDYNGVIYQYHPRKIETDAANLYMELLACARAGQVVDIKKTPQRRDLKPMPLYDFGSHFKAFLEDNEKVSEDLLARGLQKLREGKFILPFPDTMFSLMYEGIGDGGGYNEPSSLVFLHLRLEGKRILCDTFTPRITRSFQGYQWFHTWIDADGNVGREGIGNHSKQHDIETLDVERTFGAFCRVAIIANEALRHTVRAYRPIDPFRTKQMKAGINAKRPLPPIKVIDMTGFKIQSLPSALLSPREPTGITQQPHDRPASEMHIKAKVQVVPAYEYQRNGKVIRVPEGLREYKEQTVPRQAYKVRGGSKTPRTYKVKL